MPILNSFEPKSARDYVLLIGGAIAGATLTFSALLVVSEFEHRQSQEALTVIVSSQAEYVERQTALHRFNALAWALARESHGKPSQERINVVLDELADEHPEWTSAGDAIKHSYGGTITAEPSSARPGWIDLRVTNLPELPCVYLQRSLRPAANEIGTGESFTSFKPEGADDAVLSSIVGCQQELNTVNFRIGSS